MLDLSDSNLDNTAIATLVGSLYQQAGLSPGQKMPLSAFQKIFASEEYADTLEKASLQLQGKVFLYIVLSDVNTCITL